MNCCLHNLLHINLHILYLYFIKMNLNLKELQESIKYIKSYQGNKIEFFNEFYFQFVFHLNFKLKLGFRVNPQLNESCANVNPM